MANVYMADKSGSPDAYMTVIRSDKEVFHLTYVDVIGFFGQHPACIDEKSFKDLTLSQKGGKEEKISETEAYRQFMRFIDGNHYIEYVNDARNQIIQGKKRFVLITKVFSYNNKNPYLGISESAREALRRYGRDISPTSSKMNAKLGRAHRSNRFWTIAKAGLDLRQSM